MYEKLTESLRKCGRLNTGDECVCFHDGCCEAEPTCMYELMRKAADAIEERDKYALTIQHEMMAEAESHIALVERLNKQIEELSAKYRWIPVTERLPKADEDVLLLFPHNQAVGFCDRDGYWGVYSGNGFYTEVAEIEPKPTHWARKLPEPPKEEAT